MEVDGSGFWRRFNHLSNLQVQLLRFAQIFLNEREQTVYCPLIYQLKFLIQQINQKYDDLATLNHHQATAKNLHQFDPLAIVYVDELSFHILYRKQYYYAKNVRANGQVELLIKYHSQASF